MMKICKTYTFAASHHLPNHLGKCRRLHGHNYRVEVEVEGEVLKWGSSEGMVMDFSLLDEFMEPILNGLDHYNLNDTLPATYFPPTAENTALYISDVLLGGLRGVTLSRVRVWETDKAWAEWSA